MKFFFMENIGKMVFIFGILFLFPIASALGVTEEVDIAGFAFSPANLTIEIGTTVHWTNNHGTLHTTTSDDGVWDSGTLNTGEDFSYTFLGTGVFPYKCNFHPLTMTAIITVVSTGAATDVSIVVFAFDPADITVDVGTVVTWTNNHNIIHTSTSDVGVWDSGNLNPGESFSYLFENLGDYPYHCTPHSLIMHGNVTVIDPPSCLCGDADLTGAVNILDVVYIINFKYKGGPAPGFLSCSDVNSDGGINILDVVYLINFKYKGGPDPNCG